MYGVNNIKISEYIYNAKYMLSSGTKTVICAEVPTRFSFRLPHCFSRQMNLMSNVSTSWRCRNHCSQWNRFCYIVLTLQRHRVLSNICWSACLCEWPVGIEIVGFAGLGYFFWGKVKFLKGKCHQRNVKRNLKQQKTQEWIRFRRIMNCFCKHLKVSKNLLHL